MIKEAYCSKEVSILLKEKGFNEKCRGNYHYEFDDNDNPIVMLEEWMAQPYNNDIVDEGFLCSAPTHQMAMAWLREIHGIFIAINNDDLDFNWQCYDLINRGSTLDPKILSESYAGYKTYEEAVEAALKYCLEKIIK